MSVVSHETNVDTPVKARAKRTYSGPGEFFADQFYLVKNIGTVIRLSLRKQVSPAFRERLMLAVISVYGCRYCTWLHTGEALRAGVPEEEITTLLEGSIDTCPEEEAVALLYAQHWADTNCRPDPSAVERLESTYGHDMARTIHVVLRMNRLGNLSGNTWDRFLHRVTFGRWRQ